MKLSAKSDYAARAMLGLARRHPSGESVRVEDLAEEQGIPSNYLVQILIELKSQQIVKSVRGKDGGYLLARPPAEVTMGDILRCFHGEAFDSPSLSDPRCAPELKAAWQKLQKALDDTAREITFQSLVDQAGDRAKMYYI